MEIPDTRIILEYEKHQDRLLPFFSSKPDGTGFGLPIALLVAKKNLGDLFLEPVPNEGTRCVIVLPISKTA